MSARKPGPLKPATIAAIRRAYASGTSTSRIAKRFKVAPSTIHRYVERRSVDAKQERIEELEEENRALRAALELAGVA